MMNSKLAVEILELTIPYDDQSLKKQYYKLALKNHPDKTNNSEFQTEKFQKINEAYEFLKNKKNDGGNEENKENEECMFNTDNFNLNEKLNYFILVKNLVKTLISFDTTEIQNLILDIIKNILFLNLNEIIEYFKNVKFDLDFELYVELYMLLYKHKDIFHIKNNILELFWNKICSIAPTAIYKLNPSLVDVLEDNWYVLCIERENKITENFHVPLWMSESFFKSNFLKEEELMVVCEPELPENIKIDENENIHITHTIDLQTELLNILSLGKIECWIENKICFEIPTKKLNLSLYQKYVFKEKGKRISFDGFDRTDVIIHVIIC